MSPVNGLAGRTTTHSELTGKLVAPSVHVGLSMAVFKSSYSYLLSAMCLMSSSLFAQTADDITDLLLITGQSNVRGSQTAYDATENSPDAVDPRVFAFTSGGTWEVADLHQAWDVNNWEPGNGSLQDPTRQPYNNFAFHAAKTIVQLDPNRVVGIVVASAPGEGIQHWDTCAGFFSDVAGKANAALSALPGKNQFDGILWHQGETDWQISGTSDVDASALEKAYDNYYPEKLENLIQNFRDQPWFGSNRPFICGETSRAPVNERLNELNTDASEWTACVAGDDFSTRDGTHFDAAGLREIGRRYGEAYVQMQNTAAIDSTLPDVTITSPPVDGTTQDHFAVYAGSASDTGSGIKMVRAAVQNRQTGLWFNFINQEFGECFSSIRTELSEIGANNLQWSLGIELPAGSYTLSVQASDGAGNSQ